MPDMLVKLWELPEKETVLNRLKEQGILIRKPIGPEKAEVIRWIGKHFSEHWEAEAEVAFFRPERSIYIALQEREKEGEIVSKLLGFACYDATAKGYFGPTGVSEAARGKGLGTALLLSTLHAMREEGYGYCIIGGAGPVDFYRKLCGATVIEDSVPGIYRGML